MRIQTVCSVGVIMAAGALIAACSHENPLTGATAGPGARGVQFLSIRDGSPIVGMTVRPDLGQSAVTDSQGMATLPPEQSGIAVTIQAPGFLGPRRFKWSPGAVERLFPDDTQMPAWWILQALYNSNMGQWLWRPEPGTFLIVPSAEVYADSFAMDRIAVGVDIINARHHSVHFTIGGPGDHADRMVNFRLNPAADGFAVTSNQVRGATIIGASIDFSIFRVQGFSEEMQKLHLSRVVAHELGHVCGLCHPQPISGVYLFGMMFGGEPVQDFAEPEADMLNWLMVRPAGTRPMDDSTGTPVAAASGQVSASSARTHMYTVCTMPLPR